MPTARCSLRTLTALLRVLLIALAAHGRAGAGMSESSATTPNWQNPSWSPGGKHLAAADEKRGRIRIHNLDGSGPLEINGGPSSGYAYRWSADGARIALKLLVPGPAGGLLQVPAIYHLATRELVRLHEPVPQAGVPSFSNMGIVAFTVGDDLILIAPDGAEQTIGLGAYVNLAAISPDGRLLAFNDEREQIWMLELASGHRTRLTNDERAYFNPVWSPDSTKLLVSTVSGHAVAIDLVTTQTFEIGGGERPSWGPDSKTLFYTRVDRIPGVKVRAAELRHVQFDGSGGGKAITLDENCIGAAVSPDGKKLAFASLIDGGLHQVELAKVAGVELSSAATAIATFGAGDTADAVPAPQTESTAEGTGGQLMMLSTTMLPRPMPWIHQAWDTPDDFNGNSACGPTSAMMCLAYYDLLPYWDVTCSYPYSHVSHYGRYICQVYDYNGYTYDDRAKDPSGNYAYGGFGYVWGSGGSSWDTMSRYIYRHALGAGVDGWPYVPEPTWEKLVNEINNQCPFVLLNEITTAGHYIVTVGYVNGQHTAIYNDPWGNKNISYPGYNGAGAYYDWPGYNNGYQNINYAQSFIYARPAFIVESRSGGQNYGNYSDIDGGTWGDANNESTAPGVNPLKVGSRYGSTYRSVAGEKHATFRADLPTAGYYEVFATWGSRSDLRNPILHRVTHFAGVSDVDINQSATANTWVSLGTYTFSAGTNVGQVDVNNLHIDVSGSMLADAIKWEFRSLISSPPTVSAQPSAQAACEGGTATFIAGGSGPGVLCYQWRKDGSNLSNGGHYSGVNTPTLTITGADAGDLGNYSCVISNAVGSVTTDAPALTLKAATAVTLQPVDARVCPGVAVTLTTGGSGYGSVAYRWQKDGADLSNGEHYAGVTTAALTVLNPTVTEVGSYRCIITAGCGDAPSEVAELTLKGSSIADFNADCAVDTWDLAVLLACLSGPGATPPDGCAPKSLDGDSDVDQADFAILQRCLSGPGIEPDPTCAN